MTHPITVLAVTAGSILLGEISLLAQSSAPGSAATPIITGGTAAISVAGLVYVANLIIKGKLVSRETNSTEQRYQDLLQKAHDREVDYLEIIKKKQDNETTMTSIITDLTGLLARIKWSVEGDRRL